MLTVTHIVVSLLLVQLLSLDKNNAFIGLVFGVFIDLDHLIGLGSYAQTNGLRPLTDWHTLTDPGGQWKSLFHSPIALGVIVPMSFVTMLAVPLVFWAVHVSMDFVEESFLGNFSSIEAMLLVISSVALVLIRYSKYTESYSLGSFEDFLRSELRGLRNASRSGSKDVL